MGMDVVLGFITDIGLSAVKDKIKGAAMEAVARKRLMEFLERQHKLNFNCTMEEEIDFGGLSIYICNDLIEDIKLRFFGNREERDDAHKTIVAKASCYAQTKTQMSKHRATKMVSSAIKILGDYYKSKTNCELAYSALRLTLEDKTGIKLPPANNGLGYNNLIYIALLLARMQKDAMGEYYGSNAKLFSVLAIEEPEAHLHPSLQYRFLKFLNDNMKSNVRQIFISTHFVLETDSSNQGLDFILNPNITSENNRVYYVALSRAREKLFISVSKLDSEVKDKLIKAGFEIINCAKVSAE